MFEVSQIILLSFAVEALVLGFLMRRRGFDGYVWTLLGMFLGPIAVVLAITFALRPPKRRVEVLREGERAAGSLDILVGFDGSPESFEAVARVHALFGSRIGRVAVARVTPIDAPEADQAAAADELQRVVDEHPELHAAAVMLHGEPVAELKRYAGDAGYGMIVAGTRGAGLSKLIGSVASALAHDATVPVLLVDAKSAALPL